MKLNARVSTTFAAQHDTHQVKLLVTIGAEAPVTRPPINAALVIDRSGSMAGAPLEHACAAAAHFASFLGSSDRLTLVVFDDAVHTVLDGVPGNDPRIAPALRTIASGGQTNLSGGWLEGHRHLSRHRVAGTNRILLLTDGQANRGLTAPADLEQLTAAASAQGVTTTCIGFGPGFNEDLLLAMSAAGGGRFWYVELLDQMGDAFGGEIEGLVSLAAQNVNLAVRLTHPGVAGVSIKPALRGVVQHDDGWSVPIGDLYAVQTRSVALLFHVAQRPDDAATPLGEVVVSADILHPDGIEHRTVTLPVMATLDGRDRVEPEVETTWLRFEVAEARETAIRLADAGDTDSAAETLRSAAAGLGEELSELREDLLREAQRLTEHRYEAADRKYQVAQAVLEAEGRHGYARRIGRRGKG